MTTYAGQLSEILLVGAIPGQAASRPTRADPATNGLASFELVKPLAGTLTRNQPTSILTRTLTGALSRSYLNDLYFKIYYIPTPINFGFLGVTSTLPTIIWNSNFVDETIESVSETGFSGLSLTTPSLPHVMKPLAQLSISVQASIVGPIVIAGDITFVFSPTTFVPDLPVIGTRAALWPLSINWKNPVTVTLEYKTDIIKSRDETEMRRAVRQTPRKTIEFTSTAMLNNDTITLHQFLATSQPVIIIIPEPGMHAYLTAPAFDTDSVIFLPTPLPLWLLAGLTLRIDYGRTSNVNEVTAIDNDTGAVTLVAPLGVDTQAGTRVVALREANFENTLSASRALRLTAEMTNKFAVVPASEPVYTPSTAPTTYLDYEVFLLKPDWSKDIAEQFDWTVEVIDYDWGIQQRYPISPQQTRTVKAQYWDNGADKCLLVADFFYRMLGMQGEFFMPTFDDDLPLRTPILLGQNTLRVIGIATNTAILQGFPFRQLAIKITDGTYIFATFVSASVVSDGLGTDTLIEIDATLPAVPLSTILMISWMPIWRFASDQMTMEWQTDEVGVATINIRTRPYKAGSAP